MTTPLTSDIPFRERAGAFLLLALICAAGVFNHSLWSNDAREGAMIAEMFRENHWVTPVFNGVAYFEKPPLMHWTALVFCRLTGHATAGLARLPAALYGFGALLLIVSMARSAGRERAGWIGAFLCATSALFFEYSRVALTDSAIAFMTLLSLRLFWAAWSAENPAHGKYAVFLIVSALSFYAKGLLGPGLAWVSVCLFLALQRKWKQLFLLPLLFIPIFIVAILPWALALYKAGGSSFLKEILWANQFGRFFAFNNPDLPVDPYFVHKEPVWFYLIKLPARLLPWTLFAPAAICRWFKPASQIRGSLPDFLRATLLAMLLVLHVSSAKAAAYAMPVFPIIFIMTGFWYEDALLHQAGRAARALIQAIAAILGVACFLAPLALLAGVLGPLFGLQLFWMRGSSTAAATAILALCACGFVVFMFFKTRGPNSTQALMAVPMAMGLVVALLVIAAIPAYDFQRTYIPAVEMARAEISAGRQLALVSELERDHGQFLFYLNSRIDRLAPYDDLRQFLAAAPGRRGLIAPKKHHDQICAALHGLTFQITSCDYPGYKSAEFEIFRDILKQELQQ